MNLILKNRNEIMKPSLESLSSEIPEVDENILTEHLERLDKNYFKSFRGDDLKQHILALSGLSSESPVKVIIDKKRDESIDCTILSFDYPSEFSLITGILAGMGFNIISGDVYTYKRISGKATKQVHQKRFASRMGQDVSGRRKIIDYFSGVLSNPMDYKQWEIELKDRLTMVIGMLERGGEESRTEARNLVNEMVVKQLTSTMESEPVLYPVEIQVDNEAGPFTRLMVVSQDTPAFLYALSNALSLNNILIEHVRIRTIRGRIEDRIDLVDSLGKKIEDDQALDRIRLSVLLTKQFTYFLSKAPDPYSALSRFEHMVSDILQQPTRERWIAHLTDPRNLMDLARLLGTSDYLWEDFIRLQYESLLPLLKPSPSGRMFSKEPATVRERLDLSLKGSDSLEDKKIIINRFKDHEIFLIDLDHILNPGLGFRSLADRLTHLAEIIVNAAAQSVYNHLAERYGKPRSVEGLNTTHTILGLGKLGGAALGYASDIELLFVYSDNGKTDGKKSIDNSEFFNLLVKGVYKFIEAKREGIFQIDLRLRPHGDSGPLACSVKSFFNYYGQGGKAHSYERLALVRLRPIGGDPELGARLERMRDEIVYFSESIDLAELWDLRERQIKEKTMSGKANAKFSPGGLVDIEYGVQTLQALYGKDFQDLRTARIHEALMALTEAGVIARMDSMRLIDAYDFFRNLINGLRMLRGSAKDLFLPPVEANEFGHLARRMGYVRGGPIDSAQRLHIDFETHMAVVRAFTEKYFGREPLLSHETGTVVDVIFSQRMADEIRYGILSKGGIRNPSMAYTNLQSLAGKGSRQEAFVKVALLAWDILKRTPDPDMALNNWERFIHSLASPEFHYSVLLSQPMRLEILLSMFSGSQFLSDTLVRNPGFLEWLINPEILRNIRKKEAIAEELRKAAQGCSNHEEWLNRLRRFRRREILRIGTRDICLGVSTRETMQELSMLAEICIQTVLENIFENLKEREGSERDLDKLKERFCIMALGKLGGNELNYSSDIDLVGIWNGPETQEGRTSDTYNEDKDIFTHIMGQLSSDLSSHTEEGYAYRVDLRLRPYGSDGELICTADGFVEYYKRAASLWEIQAALKLRPIAGNLFLGYDLLKRIRPILLRDRNRTDIVMNIEKMRNAAIKASAAIPAPTVDVKSGIGGLRDVEFLVQGLQLIHASHNPVFIEGNTLLSMELLGEEGILPLSTVDELREDYLFLRRTEHFLQMLEDRQTHSLPDNENELASLAKRMLGVTAGADQFMEQLNSCLNRVRKAYTEYLLEW